MQCLILLGKFMMKTENLVPPSNQAIDLLEQRQSVTGRYLLIFP